MSPSLVHMPSPCSDTFDLTVQPEYRRRPLATMLKIQSLLNPQSENRCHHSEPASTLLTPTYTAHGSSPASTPRPETPTTPIPPNKRRKLIKDAALFLRGPFRGSVNFPPFECTEDSVCLTAEQQHELSIQHQRFGIFPSGHGNEGLISDYVRHIPYSSERKDFLDKTGRDAFDVFQYTFTVPGDLEKRPYVVMWDYHIGLVRITPFFKACKYAKTAPAKALTSNTGLKDLSHSITGGALAAQGYWMPYACARAICLTFCYPIRWALTPIFGPSFIKECLRPGDTGFAHFKIDAEVVRCATLEAEGWKAGHTVQNDTAFNELGHRDVPRSEPYEHSYRPQLSPRTDQPSFKFSSPFDSEPEHHLASNHTHAHDTVESPQLSPKTQYITLPNSGWTSINSSQFQHPVPHSSTGDGMPLLTEPHHSPTVRRQAGAAEQPDAAEGPIAREPPTGGATHQPPAHNHPMVTRYSVAAQAANNKPILEPDRMIDEGDSRSTSASESDDEDIPGVSASRERTIRTKKWNGKAKAVDTSRLSKFTAADARAAHWLLNLRSRDQELAAHYSRLVEGAKRKAGEQTGG